MVHKNQKLSVYEKKNLQETYDASRPPVTVKPRLPKICSNTARAYSPHPLRCRLQRWPSFVIPVCFMVARAWQQRHRYQQLRWKVQATRVCSLAAPTWQQLPHYQLQRWLISVTMGCSADAQVWPHPPYCLPRHWARIATNICNHSICISFYINKLRVKR